MPYATGEFELVEARSMQCWQARSAPSASLLRSTLGPPAFIPPSRLPFKAVFVLNTAMTLDKLEMHHVSVLRPGDDDWDALGSLRWADINKFISMARNSQNEPSIASHFVYAKPMRSPEIDDCSTAVDVFRLTEGVFGISVSVYHEEDMGCSYAEPVGHYVAYNAATRALFTYRALFT